MNRLREKTTATLLITIFMISMMTFIVSAKPKKDYYTITEGEIFYSEGHYLEGTPIPTGFDDYGYNYQGHMFKGSYYNSYAGKDGYGPWTGNDVAYLEDFPEAEDHWAWPYRDVYLMMKWNDAWLSNKDRDKNGQLDRYYGFGSYIGSGAWLTNHQSGEYEEDDETIKWNYFVKIVAQSYEGQAEDIGAEEIWGAFMIIQQVSNDPGLDEHGILTLTTPTGFGYYK